MSPAAVGKANILLVDDKPDKLFALSVVLAELGQNIVEATSGEDALRKLLKEDFAVILLDVNMPGIDGFETAELIRKRKATEKTPIIFITGIHDSDVHRARGYSLGAVDYIFSPVVPEVLRAKVSVFIDLHNKTAQVKQQEEMLRAAAELRASGLEVRLQGLLNKLNVGVFRAQLDGRIIEANPAFYRLLGIKTPLPDNAAVNICDYYVDPGSREHLIEELQEKGQIQGHNVQLRPRGRSAIWVAMTKTLSTGPGAAQFIDGLVEDINERKLATEALTKKMEELARSNASLEQFAYIASHDLQEPLRMISAYSSLLESRYKDRLDEKARGYLHYAIEGADHMQRLIKDLLSFARVGTREIMTETINCDDILSKVKFNLRATIEETGATVSNDPLPIVRGDPVLIVQLFQNLISNGIKFSRKGSVKVHVKAKPENGMWTFSVIDNGIGIPDEFKQRVFAIFHRLHSRAEYPGTGIGLAVCQKVVEHHHGRIWIETAPGGGCEFKFTLPMRDENESGLHATAGSGAETTSITA